MNKLEYKEVVLKKAIERQQEIIDDFKLKIQELQGGEMNINEGQFDSGQRSIDESTNEIISRLADQLNFVVDEMNHLNRLDVANVLKNRAMLGSIVKTDKGTFFPCVSVEKFLVNGDELFGISAKAPLFQEMKGKKKGESFSYKGNDYRILEVY